LKAILVLSFDRRRVRGEGKIVLLSTDRRGVRGEGES
jgi:hypothetical protein